MDWVEWQLMNTCWRLNYFCGSLSGIFCCRSQDNARNVRNFREKNWVAALNSGLAVSAILKKNCRPGLLCRVSKNAHTYILYLYSLLLRPVNQQWKQLTGRVYFRRYISRSGVNILPGGSRLAKNGINFKISSL